MDSIGPYLGPVVWAADLQRQRGLAPHSWQQLASACTAWCQLVICLLNRGPSAVVGRAFPPGGWVSGPHDCLRIAFYVRIEYNRIFYFRQHGP